MSPPGWHHAYCIFESEWCSSFEPNTNAIAITLFFNVTCFPCTRFEQRKVSAVALREIHYSINL